DSDARVRLMAAYWLGVFKNDRIIPALIRKLDDPDPNVQGMAAQSLGEFGEEAAASVPALEAMVKRQGPVSLAAPALNKIDPAAAQRAGLKPLRTVPSYE